MVSDIVRDSLFVGLVRHPPGARACSWRPFGALVPAFSTSQSGERGRRARNGAETADRNARTRTAADGRDRHPGVESVDCFPVPAAPSVGLSRHPSWVPRLPAHRELRVSLRLGHARHSVRRRVRAPRPPAGAVERVGRHLDGPPADSDCTRLSREPSALPKDPYELTEEGERPFKTTGPVGERVTVTDWLL